MLTIRLIHNFKGEESCLLVTGDRAGFLKAADFVEVTEEAYLNDAAITSLCDLGELQGAPLPLTRNECTDIAQSLRLLVSSGEPQHVYYEIAALPDVEILFSYREYS